MTDDNNEETITYKIILLGDSTVGKTCIFNRIINDEFNLSNLTTVGYDYKSLEYEVEIEKNGTKKLRKTKILLNDSAGQTRYREITKSLIRNTNGIIMVYDITNKNSFDNVVTQWIKSIEKEYGRCEDAKTCIFLLGNKSDLVQGEEGKKLREVKTEEAEKLAKDFGLNWGGECSAKDFTKKQFDEIIVKFIKIIYEKFGYDDEYYSNNMQLDKKKTFVEEEDKKKCNC